MTTASVILVSVFVLFALIFKRPIGWLLGKLAQFKKWDEAEDYYEPTRGLGILGNRIGEPRFPYFWPYAIFWLLVYAGAMYSAALVLPEILFAGAIVVGTIILLVVIFVPAKFFGLLGEIED